MKQDKKDFLLTYRERVRKIARIESELEEIKIMRFSVSAKSDGMPRGKGGHHDLSDYMAKLDCLERELIAERYRRIKTYTEIEKCIRNIENENERDILFCRYIRGMDWADIAEEMMYSERQVLRIHGKALENLKLPEDDDVSECQ